MLKYPFKNVFKFIFRTLSESQLKKKNHEAVVCFCCCFFRKLEASSNTTGPHVSPPVFVALRVIFLFALRYAEANTNKGETNWLYNRERK